MCAMTGKFMRYGNMITLRSLRWPNDRAALLSLDASFTTDRIFRLARTEHSVTLAEVATEPLIYKSYSLAGAVDAIAVHDWVQVAEYDKGIAGVASMTIDAWNRRAILQHLYVTSEARRLGVGKALVGAAIDRARELNARCVWVETQTVNYAAVQFYRKMGFAWCGFDSSLYDPVEVSVAEVALFFCRDVQ
jgi:ribosomal protein S18 acetylase RimI-like enzyme